MLAVGRWGPGGGAGEGEGEGEGEGASPGEVCNAADDDDDGDGDVDEVDVVVESLRVEFDPRTAVEPGRGSLEVSDGEGRPVEGSPFSGDELAGRTVEVPGSLVRIRIVTDA